MVQQANLTLELNKLAQNLIIENHPGVRYH